MDSSETCGTPRNSTRLPFRMRSTDTSQNIKRIHLVHATLFVSPGGHAAVENLEIPRDRLDVIDRNAKTPNASIRQKVSDEY